MDKIDRKAAQAAYKEQKIAAGVCAIRCEAAGRVWVIESRNVDTHQNRVWFELRQGACRDRDIQAAWTAHGEAAFRFEVLERLSEDVSEMLQRTELKKLGQTWRAKLA